MLRFNSDLKSSFDTKIKIFDLKINSDLDLKKEKFLVEFKKRLILVEERRLVVPFFKKYFNYFIFTLVILSLILHFIYLVEKVKISA
jgi:hypothetical protein